MKRLIHFAIWLYPRSRRKRYGSEFAALLEDVEPHWRSWFDVLSGALEMHIRNLGPVPIVCALAESGGAKSATLVQLLYNDPTHTLVALRSRRRAVSAS